MLDTFPSLSRAFSKFFAMAKSTLFVVPAWLVISALASSDPGKMACPVFYPRDQPPPDCLPDTQLSFLSHNPMPALATGDSDFNTKALEDTFTALTVMQSEFFTPEQGTWLEAIDWTAAVMETVLSGTLTSLSMAFSDLELVSQKHQLFERNLVDSFFSQALSSYFGQDALSIRHQVSRHHVHLSRSGT